MKIKFEKDSSIEPVLVQAINTSQGFFNMLGWKQCTSDNLNDSRFGLELQDSHHWNQFKAFPSKAIITTWILSILDTSWRRKYLSNKFVQPNASSLAKRGISNLSHHELVLCSRSCSCFADLKGVPIF